MAAFNVVRFRVKPGMTGEFIEAHRKAKADWPGARRFNLVDAGDRRFVLVGEWDDMASMAAARPYLVAVLDSFRHTLEDLGGDLGVTDPVSGPAVLEIKPG